MSILFDAYGNPIGDSASAGSFDAGSQGGNPWDSTATDPSVGMSQVGPSDVGYLQTKVNEFQSVLNAVDKASRTLEQLQASNISPESQAEITPLLDEYVGRKQAFKFAAEAFNGVSSMVNAVGGSMGSVNIPSGLGFAPLAIPLAWAAAVAGAAVLVSWAMGWLDSAQVVALKAANSITDTATRDTALAAVAQSGATSTAAGGSIGQIANIAKYAAIAAAAWFAYKIYQQYEKA